ncbi:hypothetical protein HDU88_001209 [Geranomyces variabilis]|nr:hypothetical protein HDU88_001209 [Geranomyces variabilis]
MPKKTTTKASPSVSDHAPLLDISEDEQWRIVNETGLLHKLRADPNAPDAAKASTTPVTPFAEDYVFQSILLTIPLTTLHGFLDYVVHLQYGFQNLFDTSHVLRRQVPLAPALFLFMWLTSRFRARLLAQVAFCIASIVCGCGLIRCSEGEPAFGEMAKAPGLAVLWVYFVVMMRLGPAVASLALCFAYYARNWARTGGIRGGFEL